DEDWPSLVVQFKVSDFGFEMQDSSNFEISIELAPLLPVFLMLCVTTHDNPDETEYKNRSADVEFPHCCRCGAPRPTDRRGSCHHGTHVRGRHRERTGFLSRCRTARREALQCGLQSPGRARAAWHNG